MPVIARDAVASDHLVYAWPFPIGPEEYEVSCSDDEQVVMCPAWLVGDRLGPGRHRWRTPDPMRPTSAFFVLTAPVEVSFDMTTSFLTPSNGMPVRLRASGSMQVRCADPGLLIAQFVGLPFDQVNEGVLRSVSRSVERMIARLLTRRVVMAGTPVAVTDTTMHANIVEELIAYNPAAGAVFGIELMRLGHLSIYADDGTQPWPTAPGATNGDSKRAKTSPDLLETVRGTKPANVPIPPPLPPPPTPVPERRGNPMGSASGEIVVKPKQPAATPDPHRVIMSPVPTGVEVPQSPDEMTQPGVDIVRTPPPGSLRPTTAPHAAEPRGAILGIGTSPIGGGSSSSSSASASSAVAGEIPTKVAPGQRVLVPGPDGLMQSATVRQLLQGYYELEVGGSGETIWVPMNGVVPE
jgi:hypothetical protein